MLKYLKRLASDSIIYGLSGVIISLINLFLVPVYTRIFAPSDYGTLNLINVTFFLLNIFVTLGLDNSVALWYWDKDQLEEQKTTFSSWAWFMFGFSGSVALPILLFPEFVSNLVLKDPRYGEVLQIASINLIFSGSQKVILNWLKIQRKPIPTLIISLIISLIYIGMSILLVAHYRIGIKGVYIAQLVASIFSFITTMWLMREWLHIKYFNFGRLKEMLVFSLPLVPASIAYWLLNSAGSYFMEYYADKTEIGLYQIGSSLGGGINLVITAFLQAWVPFAMSVSKNEDAKNIYADSLLLYLIVIGFFQTLLGIFSSEILYVVTTPEYFPASHVVAMLGMNALILGISQVVSIGSNIAKSNLPYGKAVLIGSAITIILFYLFVPIYGKEGSAISTITGNAVTAGLVYFYSQRLYPIPYDLNLSFLILVLTGTFCVVGNLIPSSDFLSGIFYKIPLFFIYALTLFLLNRKNIILLRKI